MATAGAVLPLKRKQEGDRYADENAAVANGTSSCIACSDAQAAVLQWECGHSILCFNCAFRIFSKARRNVIYMPPAPAAFFLRQNRENFM